MSLYQMAIQEMVNALVREDGKQLTMVHCVYHVAPMNFTTHCFNQRN